jgi:DNA-binding response OmpR family regulator
MLDIERRLAFRNGEAVELTAKEFDLAELFMKNPGGSTAAKI